ncbi:DUF4124 domain-containing protein [uncultured Thiodictyon sp.]|jgi:hypothetical protein|uniref:DUF4124 domain-containing protein n=1 Tax=uncultured Thiodictyon sp. TaxID=1846217 RepID=UPI0025CECA45|nr:DUF4124 domain-containing protein [uncultured Thiodictyon sp.]
MIRILPVFIFFMSIGASAQVFKWVDADGRTQFSDRREPDSQAIGLKLPKPAAADSTVSPPGAAPKPGPYSAFEILSPETNKTLRQPEDTVAVSLLLDPPLMEGHKIELVLDDVAIPVEKSAGTQLNLQGLNFGSHRAYAQIRDPQGAVIAGTSIVIFHLRKPIPPGVLP